MRRTMNPITLVLVLAWVMTGCASDDPTPDTMAGPQAGGDGPAMGAGDLPETCIVDFDHFKKGLTAEADSGGFSVRIEGADYIPARKYENKWTVTMMNDAGEPASEVTFSDVEPFMPAHGHGSQTTAVITDMGEGMFEVDKIDLWMDGGWEVRFKATVDGTAGVAVFNVCIPK